MRRTESEELELFDCNAAFGVRAKPALRFSRNADELVEEMSFCGIGRALVRHAAMLAPSPVEGNRRVTEEIAGRGRLEGTWAALPYQTGEVPKPDAFLAEMSANGVRALRAWPREHQYLLSRGGMGDLLAALEERRVPLFVEVGGVEQDTHAGWTAVEALLGDFPRLTLCAIPLSDWGQDRFFRPLMETYRRLHIGIESYQLAGGLEDLRRQLGSDRLLFGSGYPRLAMGGAATLVRTVEIHEDDRKAIAGGNLERVLSEALV